MATLADLRAFSETLPEDGRTMPAMFVGHGSPMNAIEDNSYARRWEEEGKNLPRPLAILCISAHWETRGTFVTAMTKPETIHDFGGFPKALFDMQYPASGNPELAGLVTHTVASTPVVPTNDWGLDHGCWSVLARMYPKADIPVVQLSISRPQSPQWHYDLGRELAPLRKRGILIIGSGNMVHNLRMIDWENMQRKFDWAEAINEKFKHAITTRDHKSLVEYSSFGDAARMAIPTNEHYLPLLYTLALQEKHEHTRFFNDETMNSISMTSVVVG
jgi:4,5-DOPA dioxygenase extradiol